METPDVAALARELADRIGRLPDQVKACSRSGEPPAVWYAAIDEIMQKIIFDGEAVAHWVEDNRHPGEAREFRGALQGLHRAIDAPCIRAEDDSIVYSWELDANFELLAESLVDDLERWADEMEAADTAPRLESITKPEAESWAQRLATKDLVFKHGTAEQWAARIEKESGKPCSDSLVKKLDYWKKTRKETGRSRRRGGGRSPVHFSKKMEAVVGRNDNPLEKMVAREEQDTSQGIGQAIALVESSAMKPKEKRATVEKLRAGGMTPAEAVDMVKFLKRSKRAAHPKPQN